MTKGERIKKLRKHHKLTLDELAERLGTTKQTVFKYENDIVTNIPSDKIETLANILNTTPAYIMGWDDEDYKNSIIHPEIPLYTDICCGNGLFVDDQIEDYIAIPDRYIKKGREYFANVASGDSMIGKSINDGDVLVFEKTNVLSNGDIGSFCIGDEYVCKIFRQLNNGLIILESANDKYEPIEIDLSDESQCFRIIGKLIATFKKY